MIAECLKFDASFTTTQLTALLKIVGMCLDKLNDHLRTFALIRQ